MISSGGTGGGSGLLTGMGTGRVAGEVGLIGPASCAFAGITPARRSTAAKTKGVMSIKWRFIVCTSFRNSLDAIHCRFVASASGCSLLSGGLQVADAPKPALRPSLANSVPQSELSGCSTRRGRGNGELNGGREVLGNDDCVRRGPFHYERAAAGSLDFKARDFRRNYDWVAR